MNEREVGTAKFATKGAFLPANYIAGETRWRVPSGSSGSSSNFEMQRLAERVKASSTYACLTAVPACEEATRTYAEVAARTTLGHVEFDTQAVPP